MLERRRMLAAAPAAIACPVSGWLSAAPSAAAPGWSLHDACPAASPVCAIPPMPPPRREVRPPPPRGPAARIAREAAGGCQSAIVPSPSFEPPEEANPLSALLSGGKALLEGGILSLAGPVDEKSPEEARTRADAGAEPGIAGNGANCGAAARADGGASQRALLRRRHVGAGGVRDGDDR